MNDSVNTHSKQRTGAEILPSERQDDKQMRMTWREYRTRLAQVAEQDPFGMFRFGQSARDMLSDLDEMIQPQMREMELPEPQRENLLKLLDQLEKRARFVAYECSGMKILQGDPPSKSPRRAGGTRVTA